MQILRRRLRIKGLRAQATQPGHHLFQGGVGWHPPHLAKAAGIDEAQFIPFGIPESDAGMGAYGCRLVDPEKLSGHTQMDPPMPRLAAVFMGQVGHQVFTPAPPALNATAPKSELKEGWLLGAGNGPLAKD